MKCDIKARDLWCGCIIVYLAVFPPSSRAHHNLILLASIKVNAYTALPREAFPDFPRLIWVPLLCASIAICPHPITAHSKMSIIWNTSSRREDCPLLIHTRVWLKNRIRFSILEPKIGKEIYSPKSLPPSQWPARPAVIMTFIGVSRLPLLGMHSKMELSEQCLFNGLAIQNSCRNQWQASTP